MPTTSSAKKALKVSEKKRSRNRRFQELLKESVKSFEGLLKNQEKDAGVLQGSLSKVYSRLDTLVKKNIIHQNNADRRKSRYAKMISSPIA